MRQCVRVNWYSTMSRQSGTVRLSCQGDDPGVSRPWRPAVLAAVQGAHAEEDGGAGGDLQAGHLGGDPPHRHSRARARKPGQGNATLSYYVHRCMFLFDQNRAASIWSPDQTIYQRSVATLSCARSCSVVLPRATTTVCAGTLRRYIVGSLLTCALSHRVFPAPRHGAAGLPGKL